MRVTEAEYAALLKRMHRPARPARAPMPTEAQEQEAVVVWARANVHHWPDLALLFHIPNGGAREKATAVQLQAAGVQPGVPDLFLPCPRRSTAGGVWHGLWIEMKRADHSNGPSAAQLRWLAELTQRGYQAAVCYGALEAVRVLEAYLSLEAP